MSAPAPLLRTRVRNRAIIATATAVWLTGGAVLNTGTHLPTCPFKALTGLDCPGCGSTRAASALLHGDVLTALDHNALLVGGALVLLALLVANRVIPAARPVWSWVLLHQSKIALVAVLGFWALRLVPLAPFSYLASR